MKRSSYPWILCSLILIAGCGGDDDEDTRNVSGTWTGALTKVRDTCNPAGPQILDIRHTVNQNEEAVELVAETGVTFLGNVTGGDGFSVDGTSPTVGNASCQDATRIEYDDIDDDDDITGSVEMRIERSCGAVACEIEYSGTATRTLPAGVAPTPSPQGVAQSGCAGINQQPFGGAYSGDGGCGISTVGYRVEQRGDEAVVVLEPFGANGATSFVVNDETSTALSSRDDLTILGDDGNSCTMICSAPSTFSVQCFKDGGDSCLERF